MSSRSTRAPHPHPPEDPGRGAHVLQDSSPGEARHTLQPVTTVSDVPRLLCMHSAPPHRYSYHVPIVQKKKLRHQGGKTVARSYARSKRQNCPLTRVSMTLESKLNHKASCPECLKLEPPHGSPEFLQRLFRARCTLAATPKAPPCGRAGKESIVGDGAATREEEAPPSQPSPLLFIWSQTHLSFPLPEF